MRSFKIEGKVFLVGSGPGDPGLLTVRGKECLQRAEVVLYDNLCNPFLLRGLSQGAKVLFAGKHAGERSVTQKQIERMMIRYARAGKQVVRLKGGDPLLFGRGAEEAEILSKAGIPFEIVPGITSAIAVPAYAGIPVTHREYASGVAMITAHESSRKREERLDYPSLAKFPGSLVVLMGVKSLDEVAHRLVRAGKSIKTPVAAIHWGTRGFQKTVTGHLGNIVERARTARLQAPSVAVIGEVVKCRKTIRWFERKPLFGRKILLAGSQSVSQNLSKLLRERGAEVLDIPMIHIRRERNLQTRMALRRLRRWSWVILTSPSAAKIFLSAVCEIYDDVRALAGVRLATVGDATDEVLRSYNLRADLVSRTATGQGLVAALRRCKFSWSGAEVLLPRSSLARKEIEEGLYQLGARPYPVVFYRNEAPRWTWELDAVERVGADSVVFTSSSTVKHFALFLRKLSKKTASRLRCAKKISIGPSTSKTLRQCGVDVVWQASKPSAEEIVRTIVKSNSLSTSRT